MGHAPGTCVVEQSQSYLRFGLEGHVLGDARLKLEERVSQGGAEKFALLVVDAFSSDAIPIHLITRQALDIYLDNLADDGLLAFHISKQSLSPNKSQHFHRYS